VGPDPAVPLRGLTGVLPGNKPPPATGGPPVVPPNMVVTVSPPSGTGANTEQVNVPPEVLLGLGAGQLGSIEGASNTLLAKLDVYDRIIGLGPDASFAQLVVQLPILTQA